MTENHTESKTVQKPAFSRFAIIAGVIILFIVGSYLLKDGPLGPGEQAPLFNLPQANGTEGILSMETLKGKPVLIDFWSTTCPPCLMQIPILQRIQNEFPGIQVVGVAVGGESLSRLKEFSKARSVTYPIVADLRGVAAVPYNVTSLPTLFVVDANGVIVQSHEGFWPEKQLLDEVRKLINP
ncbi:MAG: TlpA family protein disulfide reductase [Deltaproteobacteria bacterium]|nr:TlpA family protein disulfide reductase [Deltaproteobacteria bacterium]